MKKAFLSALLITSLLPCFSQQKTTPEADRWVDSVFKSLSNDQKLAQLIIVRLSSIDPVSKKITFYDKDVENAVRKYNIGGICLFQGGPITQASFINYLQSIAKTPVLSRNHNRFLPKTLKSLLVLGFSRSLVQRQISLHRCHNQNRRELR